MSGVDAMRILPMSQDAITVRLDRVRRRISRAFLIALSVMALPGLLASLSRIGDIGFQPVMGLHITMALLTWGMLLFLRRVPYAVQAGYLVLFMLLIGLGGVYQFGLMAAGTVFLVASPPLATLLLGARAGLVALAVVLLGGALIALPFVQGSRTPGVDTASYLVLYSSWLTAIISWALVSVVLSAALHVFNRRLIESVEEVVQSQQALQEKNRLLEQLLEEREQALAEVKTLRGIIPICSYCHSIRSDEGAWGGLEAYIAQHSDAVFSHGICPNCVGAARKDAGLPPEDGDG